MSIDKSSFHHRNDAQAFNKGTAYVNEISNAAEHRTICVLGPPRSGTSMVARSLAFLEVPMGVPVPAPSELVNYEDPEFVTILHGRSSSQVDRDVLLASLSRRDGNWGWLRSDPRGRIRR